MKRLKTYYQKLTTDSNMGEACIRAPCRSTPVFCDTCPLGDTDRAPEDVIGSIVMFLQETPDD
jgi:hypothetical protein